MRKSRKVTDRKGQNPYPSSVPVDYLSPIHRHTHQQTPPPPPPPPPPGSLLPAAASHPLISAPPSSTFSLLAARRRSVSTPSDSVQSVHAIGGLGRHL
jgi:hypothetical protein